MRVAAIGLLDRGKPQSETTGPAEWGSDPAALGLLFLRLAAHLLYRNATLLITGTNSVSARAARGV